jgi:hypothetical protein
LPSRQHITGIAVPREPLEPRQSEQAIPAMPAILIETVTA